MFGGANWNDCPILSDISFNVFTNESKIEIHGCNTAIDGDEYSFSVLIYLKWMKQNLLLLVIQSIQALY